MFRAAGTGHVGFCRLLKEFGAKVNNKDGNGDTPLHLAVEGFSLIFILGKIGILF